MPDKDKLQRIHQNWNKTVPWAYLDPVHQNIPLAARDAHLRPPPPRISKDHDIFIGISNYRDIRRCGFTLFTAFSRAKHPERVTIGVVDQTQDDDTTCLDEYCKLAEASDWNECKFKSQVRIDARDSRASKGPTLARWQQQQLIENEEFCLNIDTHNQFLPNWDLEIVNEWLRTENEMAVLTTYPMGYDFIGPNLTHQRHYSSHLCNYLDRKSAFDVPIVGGMTLIEDSEAPQMSTLWGGGLSFSKCHAERRAPYDKHMNWVFWGEEYLRSMQLWTRGYDLYSPSRHGHVVFHNWSTNNGKMKRFWDNVTQVMTKAQHNKEEQLAYNRLRMVLTLPFDGPVDAQEIDKYHGGKVRSIEQFLRFSGISNVDSKLDEFRCEQLHWVPYAVPEIIEEFLPGWVMRDGRLSENNARADDRAVVNETWRRMEKELLLRVQQKLDTKTKPRAVVNETWRRMEKELLLRVQQKLDTMTKPRAVVNETWRRMEKELLLRVQQKLDTMTKPIAETSLLVRTMQHRLSVWSRPHEVLWPLALVWLGLISVWLVYKGTSAVVHRGAHK
ncbi:hypothetical protein DYB31_012159 [Aphanomyces astaci]|uniref:Uncharacterized protein n=2 Tax=Aphanomyces astaci TaxID=112090 RepID=A0A397EFF7_APHAT|nr:hypothetical protein DYB31_012159 [Aphanomyces astaci]